MGLESGNGGGEMKELNDKQLFLSFAIITSLTVNWFFGIVLSTFSLNFWVLYTCQGFASLLLLLKIKNLKD